MKKTVLITGASRGIGKACAILFAQKGYKVILNYNTSEAAAKEISAEIGAAAIKADVSNADEVKKMFALAGNVDILVNNAGIAWQRLFTDITEQEWDKMFDVNMKGMFNCCQAALPYMINKKCGKIINISSIWGITGASCEVHYSASKAAVIGFTKALAKELAPSGINVNCVAPGVIATEMNNNLDKDTINSLKEETPLGVIGTARDVANTVLFLASSESDFITGQVISPNGGIVI